MPSVRHGWCSLRPPPGGTWRSSNQRRIIHGLRWMGGLTDRTEMAATRRQLQSVWNPEGDDIPDVERRRAAEIGRPQWPTRTLNLVLALLALVSLLPVMLVIAVLIKLTSRGPVLYTQERVGLDRRQRGAAALNHRRSQDSGGRPFTMYKFRTMR